MNSLETLDKSVAFETVSARSNSDIRKRIPHAHRNLRGRGAPLLNLIELIGFSLELRLVCFGGVKPSLGLSIMLFGFFHLRFDHSVPRGSFISLPSPNWSDSMRCERFFKIET